MSMIIKITVKVTFEPPEQVSLTSHTPTAARHTYDAGRTASAGHAELDPEHFI